MGNINDAELSIFEKILVNKYNSKINNKIIQTEYLCDIINIRIDEVTVYIDVLRIIYLEHFDPSLQLIKVIKLME